jgi:hypothetical protein
MSLAATIARCKIKYPGALDIVKAKKSLLIFATQQFFSYMVGFSFY